MNNVGGIFFPASTLVCGERWPDPGLPPVIPPPAQVPRELRELRAITRVSRAPDPASGPADIWTPGDCLNDLLGSFPRWWPQGGDPYENWLLFVFAILRIISLIKLSRPPPRARHRSRVEMRLSRARQFGWKWEGGHCGEGNNVCLKFEAFLVNSKVRPQRPLLRCKQSEPCKVPPLYIPLTGAFNSATKTTTF